MQQGDFTELAQNYIHRPAYSNLIIDSLIKHVDCNSSSNIADIGAGTGKLTKMLLDRKLHVSAVEPNDSMREEGMKYTKDYDVKWHKGTGEKTGLPESTFNWVIMASSFHWTDPRLSLPEFSRILKTNGFLTVIWNPRNIESSDLHTRIEQKIYDIVPDLKRVSSGSKTNTKNWESILVSTAHFTDVIFMETDHVEVMTPERYMGAWNSVNDIRSQAGEFRWNKILDAIQSEISGLPLIEVPYKNRAWTAQKA